MHMEDSFIDAALRGWKSNVVRADKLFGTLAPDQLEQQFAPGKNRLTYLWTRHDVFLLGAATGRKFLDRLRLQLSLR